MKPVYKCDYCSKMGTEEEIREHELTCMDNYDRKSCYTCQHRGKINMVNKLVKYECAKEIDIPEGKIFEFCQSYERKDKSNGLYDDLMTGLFGRF